MSDTQKTGVRLNNSELWGGLIALMLGALVVWFGIKFNLGTVNDPGSGFEV